MFKVIWTYSAIFLSTFTTILGSTSLTCKPDYPRPNTSVICECEQSSGNDIQWLKDNRQLAACSATSGYCFPEPSGYMFNYTLTGSVAHYNLTINSYDYSDCGKYTCIDFASPPASDDDHTWIFDFESSLSAQFEEPLTNHTSGVINITTECIFQINEVTIKWYKVVDDVAIELHRNELAVTNDTVSCKQCSGEQASRFFLEYNHKEATGNDVEEVRFRVSLMYNQNPFVELNRTTKNYYYINETNSTETPNETNPSLSPGITSTVSLQITQQATSKSTVKQDLCHCVRSNNDPCCSPCRCWIVIVICIVVSRILYVQTWLSGYSLYRRPAGKNDKNDEQSFEIVMILLTGLPCVGLISSIWAFLKTGEYQKCPKWFQRVLATGFIIGCIQPGFGLFITGTAYATYVQHGSVLLFTSVLFILLVGTELALIIVCIVLEIDCYYYILIAVGYIVVWIIAVVIMVKRVYTIYMKNGKTTVPSVTKGGITSKESSVDDSGYVNLNCTCDLCGQHVLHTLKGFCLEQNMLLCNSCFSKHKCKGKHLNHNQHEAEGGRERYFPCEKKQRKGHRHLPAHGYCLVCRLYLCTECLIDHDEHELLWMPHHGAKTFDDICCFKTQTDRNSTIPLGFCKTCKMYMCKECMRSHKETHKETQHSIIYHQHEGAQTNPENCSECAKPMECYKLNVNKYLCADCYDSGFLWKKNLNSDEDSKTILKESKSCELHNEVGDGPAKYSPTDVFCVVCKLYLCKECFRVHRKFRERWIATHKENLFTCKGCQENNNVFPVECFSIKSKAFLCATCFEENKSTSSHATEQYLRPETITRLSTKSDCELHKEPFQFEERKKSSTVYCLLCKTYMCDDCFKKHLHLKQVWNKKEMKRLHQTKSRNNEVSPMQTSM